MSLLSTFCAMVIAITFFYSGGRKFLIFSEFQSTLELTFKVPVSLSKVTSLTIISCELILLPILLFGSNGIVIYSLISLILFILFCIPLYAVVTGKEIQCNCFGESSKLSWIDLIRNSLLLMSSIMLCIIPPSQTFNLQNLIMFFLAIAMVNIIINLKPIVYFLR